MYSVFLESYDFVPNGRGAGPPAGADFLIWVRWKNDREAEVYVCDRKRRGLIAKREYKGTVVVTKVRHRRGFWYDHEQLVMPKEELQQWIDGMLR